MVINWVFPDINQQARMNLENSVITHVMGKQAANADATVTLNRSTLDRITLRQTTFPQALKEGSVKLQGNGAKLQELLGMLDQFNPMFNIVTPNPLVCPSIESDLACRPAMPTN
jgi:alkyl sulfatase BDS1-like metallo-beta-lactamase superfamily hydrolase